MTTLGRVKGSPTPTGHVSAMNMYVCTMYTAYRHCTQLTGTAHTLPASLIYVQCMHTPPTASHIVPPRTAQLLLHPLFHSLPTTVCIYNVPPTSKIHHWQSPLHRHHFLSLLVCWDSHCTVLDCGHLRKGSGAG